MQGVTADITDPPFWSFLGGAILTFLLEACTAGKPLVFHFTCSADQSRCFIW